MKIVILFCVIIGSINAKPNGYYGQEYQYKKSSSSRDCTQGDATSDANPRHRRSLNMDQQSEEDVGQQVEDLGQLQQEETEHLHQHFQSTRGGYRDMVFRSPPEQEVEHYRSRRGGYRNVAWRGPVDQEMENFQGPRGGYRNVAWNGPVDQEMENFQSPRGGYRNVAWNGPVEQEMENFQSPRGGYRNAAWNGPVGQEMENFQSPRGGYRNAAWNGPVEQEMENFQSRRGGYRNVAWNGPVEQEMGNFQSPRGGYRNIAWRGPQQEVNDYDYDYLEVRNGKQTQAQGQQRWQLGQQQEPDNLQQNEYEDYSQLQNGKSHQLGQQVEGFRQEQQDWNLGQQGEQDSQLEQVMEDLHHGQQTENLQFGQETENYYSGQETGNFDLGQEAENGYLGQETEELHLGQETEDQSLHGSDLTQQTDDDYYPAENNGRSYDSAYQNNPQPFYPSNSLNYGRQQSEDEDLVQQQESLHQRPTYEDNYRTAQVSGYNQRSYSQRRMETQQVDYPLASRKPYEDLFVRLAVLFQSPPQGRSLPSSPSDYQGQSQDAVLQEVFPESVTQPPVEKKTTGEAGLWKMLGGKSKTTHNSATTRKHDFWNRLGGKFKTTYNLATKANGFFDKISKSDSS